MIVVHDPDPNDIIEDTENENENIDNTCWETIGPELLYQKNKFTFTKKEKNKIKKMISLIPPPIQYRRKVSIKKFNKNYSYG